MKINNVVKRLTREWDLKDLEFASFMEKGKSTTPLSLIHSLVTDSLLVVCTEVALNSLSIFFATVNLE